MKKLLSPQCRKQTAYSKNMTLRTSTKQQHEIFHYKEKILKMETKNMSYCCSVAKLYPSLCDPMDCSTPGFSALHYLPELTQTHVHRVSDAINHVILCRPLLLLRSIFPSIRVFSNESVLCTGGQRPGSSASTSVLPMNSQG